MAFGRGCGFASGRLLGATGPRMESYNWKAKPISPCLRDMKRTQKLLCMGLFSKKLNGPCPERRPRLFSVSPLSVSMCTSLGGELQSFKYFLSPGYADGLTLRGRNRTCAYRKWVHGRRCRRFRKRGDLPQSRLNTRSSGTQSGKQPYDTQHSRSPRSHPAGAGRVIAREHGPI